MIIVKLSGGMGNQMFQYAFGRSLARRHAVDLKLDLSHYINQPVNNEKHVFRNYDLEIFNIHQEFASETEVFQLSRRFNNIFLDKVGNKILGPKKSYIIEPHFHFSTTVFNSPGNVCLEGYWQSEKYFAPDAALIRSDFTFKNEMSSGAKKLLDNITGSNSICVNVRRGDFVTNSFHGSYGADYFGKADKIMTEKIPDRSYFIFSDDIKWCEENLKFDAPYVFVSHELAGHKFQDYLRLMIACKHFIIPNSSFAWWAVWLNQNRDKIVIAPGKWFNDTTINTSDLVPAGWIRI